MTLQAQLREKPCRACNKPFMPDRPLQAVCSPRCAVRKMRTDKAAEKAKERAERADFKRRKEAIKTLRELIEEAQRAFNAFIRYRDIDKLCIDCGKPFEANKAGGSMDAGHYLSRGSAPQHRFNEDNCFGQRKNCNMPGGATRDAFRAGVVDRIGLDRVDALESDSAVHKWTREELIGIRKHYQSALRGLKKTKGIMKNGRRYQD